MTKLKLSDLAENKPIRMTIEIPVPVHRDLVAYAIVLNGGAGKEAVSPEKLIAPMIARFMATYRAFAKARSGRQTGPTDG